VRAPALPGGDRDGAAPKAAIANQSPV
jgi:hypothetical protein